MYLRTETWGPLFNVERQKRTKKHDDVEAEVCITCLTFCSRSLFWRGNSATRSNLALCGTRKLQFFYAEIIPEFKNRPMPKTVNAICKKIIKVKNSFENSGIYFSSWEFWVSVAAPDTLCFKGLTNRPCYKLTSMALLFFYLNENSSNLVTLAWNKNI